MIKINRRKVNHSNTQGQNVVKKIKINKTKVSVLVASQVTSIAGPNQHRIRRRSGQKTSRPPGDHGPR
ncbi:hypothetical protein E2C01_089790 [Portunus trituberculatus]|uniref:Uncharacterized protein n=1 Tax=Portunus trituberculatus TaxID=210409 RepID=A0A5B7JJR9_PORTR|nr:hypothetical protein [Portunus trituberculatus]